MGDSYADLGVFHCFSVLLGLTKDGAELEFELALHVHLFHPLRDTNVFKEVRLLYNIDGFLQVYYAFF